MDKNNEDIELVVCNDETSKSEITDESQNFQASRILHKGTLILAYALISVVPVLMCYLSEVEEEIRSDYESIFNRIMNTSIYGNGTSNGLSALSASETVRWRLLSFCLFPVLAFPDILSTICQSNRRKRFDISVLILIIMSSFPLIPIYMLRNDNFILRLYSDIIN